jgi:hypothetical protein
MNPSALNKLYSQIVVKGAAGQRGYGMNFVRNRLNFVKIGVEDVTSSVTFSNGVWQHAVITWDQSAGAVKFYKNGALAQTISTTRPINLPTDLDDLVLGTWVSPSWYFQGAIDEVRIFNRPLTDGEVLDLFNSAP